MSNDLEQFLLEEIETEEEVKDEELDLLGEEDELGLEEDEESASGSVRGEDPGKLFQNVFSVSPLVSYAAADVIKPESTIMFVQGSGGAVTLTSNPSIADGVNGQLLLIIGRSDANTLTISDGNGVQFGAASRVLGLNDILTLVYEGTYANDWLEISFSQL